MANDDDNKVHLLSHHPRRLIDDDLGFADHAYAISEILTSLTADKTGLTIGIFGDWGSGKSTMLLMVEEQLKNGETKDKKYLVVKFDAWRYGKQEDIWIAFLRVILKCIERDLGPFNTARVNLTRWGARLNIGRILENLVFFAFRVFVALVMILVIEFVLIILIPRLQPGVLAQMISWMKDALEVASVAAVIWLVFGSVVRGVAGVIKRIFSTKLEIPSEILRPPLDNQQLIVVDQFRDDLTKIINSASRFRPIVVLIDDLDRAPVDQIVPVLEAIKHFESRPDYLDKEKHAPIAFVLAADRRAIEYAIASHHEKVWSQLGGPELKAHYAREYLEKIVQVFFEIPPVSPLHLNKLFDKERGGQYSIGTLAWARREARQVFTQGPKQKPREVIEAYNTFQSVWRVLQRRDLNSSTAPQLHAALVLIHYIWPKVFEQIVRYPELFFDLHAMATTEPNSVCSQTEIEEMLSLGCPASNSGAMVERMGHDHPDLLRLLAAVSLPGNLDWDGLYEILTLVKGQRAPQERHLIEVSQALMSGDPSLVKFAKRVRKGEIERERVAWLMEFLTEKTNKSHGDESPSDTDESLAKHTEQEMIKALFALGRIEDARAVDSLIKVIKERTNYTGAVVTRTLFALAHLAKTAHETEKSKISVEVEGLLKDEGIALSLRLRALRLFGFALPDESEVRQSLIRLSLHSDMRLIRDTALRYAGDGAARDHNGLWLDEAHKELQAGPPSQEAFESYFHLVSRFQGVSMPNGIRSHLSELAINVDSIHTQRAMGLLSNFHDPGIAMEYLADVAIRTYNGDRRDECLMQIGLRQNTIEWRDDVWICITSSRIMDSLEGRETLMHALGITSHKRAVFYLKIGIQDNDIQVRKAALEGLHKIADNKSDLAAAADAQAILDGLGV